MKFYNNGFILIIFWLVFYSSVVFCQEMVCENKFIIDNNYYKITEERIELAKKIKNFKNCNDNYILLRNDIFIKVVIHIVYKNEIANFSDEFIINAINDLNIFFNSKNSDLNLLPEEFKQFISRGGINFCLTSSDEKKNPCSGIIRKKTNVDLLGLKEDLYFDSLGGSTAWNSSEFLNIWIADTGEMIKGFGTFPDLVEDFKQGVVINFRNFGRNDNRRYNMGKTLVHELGHYFGLDHIWGQDDTCLNDDNIADTPLQASPYYGCPEYPSHSCETSNMFMNYMDYTDDECMILFTNEQMENMKSTIYIARSELINDFTCVRLPPANLNKSFFLYPNPAKEQITIEFEEKKSVFAELFIYNCLGEKLISKKAVLKGIEEIDISHLVPGFYILNINNFEQKLIKI